MSKIKDDFYLIRESIKDYYESLWLKYWYSPKFKIRDYSKIKLIKKNQFKKQFCFVNRNRKVGLK